MENQEPQINPDSQPTVQQPPFPPLQDPKPPKKKSPLEYALIVIIVMVLAGICFILFFVLQVFVSVNQTGTDCTNRREELFKGADKTISEFNSIDLLPGSTSTPAKADQQSGDCLDSNPTIYAERKFTTSAEAGTSFDSIKTVLASKGYKLQVDDSYDDLNPCSFEENGYIFKKGDQEIEIMLVCSSYGAKGEEWRKVPLTGASAFLTVTKYQE